MMRRLEPFAQREGSFRELLKSPRRVAAGIFGGVLLLYLLTLTKTLGMSHDSISYIQEIDVNSAPFHPHHLLYHVVAFFWLSLVRFLGVTAGSELIVEALNAIFGASTLAVYFLILRERAGWDALSATVASLLPGFSFGVWFYSVSVEVYIIPLFFLVLTLYLMADGRETRGKWLAVGMAHGCAIIFHQINVLFFPVVAFAFWRSQRSWGGLKRFLWYSLTLAFVVGVSYLSVVAFYVKPRSFADAYRWVTLYQHLRDSFWNPAALSTVVKAAMGFGRSIIGGHFLFVVPWFRALIREVGQGKSLEDELFLVRSLGVNEAWALLVLSLVIVAVAGLILCVGLKYVNSLRAREKNLAILACLWFFVYGMFFFFWDSSNVEFWIPQSLCFWLVIAVFARNIVVQKYPKKRWHVGLLGMLAGLLFVVNFWGSVSFAQDRENDYYFTLTEPATRAARAGDLIIVDRIWIVASYAQRMSPARVLVLEELALTPAGRERLVSTVESSIDRTLAAGGRVFVSEDAVAMGESGGQVLADGEVLDPSVTAIGRIWSAHRANWQVLPGDISLYYVDFPPRSVRERPRRPVPRDANGPLLGLS